MGFVVLGALTLLALAAGGAVSLRVGRGFSLAEQIVAACVTAVALVLAPILALGLTDRLYPLPLGACVGAVSTVLVWWMHPSTAELKGWAGRFRAAVLSCLKNPVSLGTTLALALLFIYLSAYVYLLPSWTWDAMNYHNTTTAYTFQNHSLAWYDTPQDNALVLCSSYPKNVGFLALWLGVFGPDDRLIDAVQLPLVLMGALALAGLCRRAGLRAPLAWSLGLGWLFMPAVFLNAPSNYADAGAASLAVAAVFFLARLDAGAGHRLFGALALGEALGSKVSGLLLTALLAPFIALPWFWAGWTKRVRWGALFREAALLLILVIGLGGYSYVRDWRRFSNPVYPVKAHIPLTDRTFPGFWSLPLDHPPFGGDNDLKSLFRSFAETKPFYIVDVRAGGFGPLFLYVLFPALCLALALGLYRALRGKPTPGLIAAGFFLLQAMLTPARWWPRYTLGFPVAGFLGFAVLLSLLPSSRAWMRTGAVALVGLFAVVQAWPARSGFRVPWVALVQAAKVSPKERSAFRFDSWQQPYIGIRDEVVQPGEASIYDDSVAFVYQLWRPDWKNRVLYMPFERDGDAATWLAHLQRENTRWAQVKRGSSAERALWSAGWTPLYACGAESCAVWLRPGTTIPKVPVFDFQPYNS